MERLESWREEARELGSSLFSARHLTPALVLRWVVEGDISRKGGAMTTHVHNVRGSLAERIEAGNAVEDRRPVERERLVPFRRDRAGHQADVFTAGRRRGTVDMFINDYTVSGLHARFHYIRRIERWMVEDLGSTNGSWLNGNRLPDNQRGLITSCDVLQMGRLVFLYLETDDLHRYLVGDY